MVTLKNGARAEDAVLFNSPHAISEMDVHHVQLWTGVRNRKGEPVQGLQKEDFQILENGQAMTITEFREDFSLPLNVGFLVDLSGSMRGVPGFNKGARSFSATLKPEDRTAVFVFDEQPRLLLPLSPPNQLSGGLDLAEEASKKVSMGGTGIYNSIIRAIHYIAGTSGRRALVVFTDGNDNRSALDYHHVIRYAQQADVQVYFIVVPLDKGVTVSAGGMIAIAGESGGAVYRASYPAQLSSAFQSIEESLRSQYLIGYQTSFNPEDTQCRDLEIKAPKGLRIRARSRICP